ncbi:MAG: hypothetical protein ACREBG_12865 [Pyrinomonadaceae bacterium]
MARGWESKSVEAQIEEGKDRADAQTRAEATAEARVRGQRLESLRLSRSRMLSQLERARHSAHREILMKGLSAIEKEMEELSRDAERPAGEK